MQRVHTVNITGKLDLETFKVFEKMVQDGRSQGKWFTKSDYLMGVVTVIVKRLNDIPLNDSDKIWDDYILKAILGGLKTMEYRIPDKIRINDRWYNKEIDN